jgi:epoxyqueuosine reductase
MKEESEPRAAMMTDIEILRQIVNKARRLGATMAGGAAVEVVLSAPSHRTSFRSAGVVASEPAVTRPESWPRWARSVWVLGLEHSPDEPELDYWGSPGGTPGNRKLTEISRRLTAWLEESLGIRSTPLAYHVSRGGVYVKDAAVLAGLGVMGKNNLLVTPQLGPRVRLRALLMEAEVEGAFRPLDGFSPCEECLEYCRRACPQSAFASGRYDRPSCERQMHRDEAHPQTGETAERYGLPDRFVVYCRRCERACPVGR